MCVAPFLWCWLLRCHQSFLVSTQCYQVLCLRIIGDLLSPVWITRLFWCILKLSVALQNQCWCHTFSSTMVPQDHQIILVSLKSLHWTIDRQMLSPVCLLWGLHRTFLVSIGQQIVLFSCSFLCALQSGCNTTQRSSLPSWNPHHHGFWPSSLIYWWWWPHHHR